MTSFVVCILPFLLAFAAANPVRTGLVHDESPVFDEELITDLNERELGWKAAKNPRFEGVSMAEAKRLLGLRIPESGVSCVHMMNQKNATAIDVPASFDSRTQWPGFILPIANQAQCGSCWAFAAAEVLSDRLAIASQGAKNLVLSPQVLVSCDRQDMGCNGGWPQFAADFLVNNGIPSDACVPYSSGGGAVPACPSKCNDGSTPTYYKYDSWDYCTGVNAIQAAVAQYGPVAVSMAVYQDFFTYSTGVYKYGGTTGLAGYHAIKLLGWGTDNGQDYWTVANSWGTTWGEAGFFRIARGNNECGIELGALDRACPLAGMPHV